MSTEYAHQPVAWSFLYDHALDYVGHLWAAPVAHEYAEWFANEYHTDATYADHASPECCAKRQEITALAVARRQRKDA
jgi:hypothetical protein